MQPKTPPNPGRRKFLTYTTSFLGIIGAFFTSLTPSAAFTLIAKLTKKKSEIPAFNGLMLQVQGAGILFGPSLTGWAVETFESWTAAGFVLIFASVLVLIIINSKIRSIDLST